jgi:hypothetical protein
MIDSRQALTKLDALLEPWDHVDHDSELDPTMDHFAREREKRERRFRLLMEMVSLTELRKGYIGRLIEAHGAECVGYLYVLICVHTGYELTYHDILSDLVPGKHLELYEGKAIIEYWTEWWKRHGTNSKYRSLDWQEDSAVLNQAYCALSSNTLESCTKISHEHPLVRQAIARRSDISNELQHRLASDSAAAVRLELALNPSAGPDTLTLLARDENSIVRRWVATHPKTPAIERELLSRDPIPEVREFYRNNVRATSEDEALAASTSKLR